MESLIESCNSRSKFQISFYVITILVLSTVSLIPITDAVRHKSSAIQRNESTSSTVDPNIQAPFELPIIATAAPAIKSKSKSKSGKSKAKGRSSSSRRASRESLAQASGLQATMGKSSQVKVSVLFQFPNKHVL